jgi:hypothetical protein
VFAVIRAKAEGDKIKATKPDNTRYTEKDCSSTPEGLGSYAGNF